LSELDTPTLVYYGSFETNFLKRMCDRYGELPEGSALADVIALSLHLVSVVFAQIYFPAFSNRLKEIAGYLGFTWSDPAASGVQTDLPPILWTPGYATAAFASNSAGD